MEEGLVMFFCSVINSKYAGKKNVGVFVNGEFIQQSSETIFHFACNCGDKVVLKVAGLLGDSIVAKRTMPNSTEDPESSIFKL